MKKRILAILAISVMMISLNVSVFATENVNDGFSIMDDTKRIEKNVSNEEELLEALTGNDENVIINVMSNIELTDGISITGTRHIILRGTSSGNKITFSEETGQIDIDTKHSMFYLTAGANIDMSIQNITLDGAKKGSLFYVGESQSGSKNKLTMEEGAILQNGYPHIGMGEATNPSGGAIRLQSGSHFIMNGGQIINNNADRYGGGIYSWATDVIVELNSGKISGNTGRYAGGVVMLGTSMLYLRDVEITDNVGKTNHGDDIFLEDLQLYLGGKTFVQSDIHLNNSNVKIFIDQPLNGEVGFKDSSKVKIEGANGYDVTSEDASHLRASKGVYYICDNQILWASESCNLTLNSNFGNNPETMTLNFPKEKVASLDKNPFKQEGYIFTGWSMNQGEGEIIYSDKDKITISSDITLYAQWKKCDHSIKSYISNGSTLTQICGGCGHVFGTATLLAPESLTYDGLTKTAGITTSQDWVGDVPVIEYYSHNEKLNNAPMDAGVYIAQITVDDVTASLDFIIEKFNLDIVYKTDEVKKHINEKEFINPLTTTVEQSVIYTSENPDVATVDANGKVTIKGAGTTVITATVNETNDYHSSFAEYRLIVTDHEYEETWKMDKEGHWKECSICGEKKTREDHVYEEKECKICQYRKENINIDNEEKETVKTSDQNDMMKWIAVLTVSGIALLINRKQRYSRK